MAEKILKRLLITASTLPASSDDPVPAFVRDQAIALKQSHPELEICVLAPHDAYSKTRTKTVYPEFTEYRFHYFWPFRLELLAGRGIVPALKARKWLYLQIPFLFLFETIATYRLARRFKPDLLYAHWFTPQGVTAAIAGRLLKLPVVFTSHASDVAVWKPLPGASRLIQTICRQSMAYSAVSEQTADRLRYFWPRDAKQFETKLSVIPMGTDLVDSAARPQRNGHDYDGKQVISFIGRLVDRKGVADLIIAFKTVHDQLPDTVLLVAGDGQDKADFQALVKQLGLEDDCVFTGYISGRYKSDILAITDVLCLPSYQQDGKSAEGLPVVFMEGLMAGKLIVASDVTGAQEHLKDGENGFIVAQHNVEQLEAALLRALRLPAADRRQLQTAARHLADNFSWPNVAGRQYTVLTDAFHRFNHR